jgi:hypothetical protein
LPERRSTVADDSHACDVAEQPRHPHRIARRPAGSLDRRLAHSARELRRKKRVAVAELEASPGDQVARRGRDAADGVRGAREPERQAVRAAVLQALMVDRDPSRQ